MAHFVGKFCKNGQRPQMQISGRFAGEFGRTLGKSEREAILMQDKKSHLFNFQSIKQNQF